MLEKGLQIRLVNCDWKPAWNGKTGYIIKVVREEGEIVGAKLHIPGYDDQYLGWFHKENIEVISGESIDPPNIPEVVIAQGVIK